MKTIQMVIVFFAVMNGMLNFAFAQNGVGGGDPNELAEFIGKDGVHLDSWYAVRQDLIKGFEMDKHLTLNLGSLNTDLFKAEILEVLRTVKVEWSDEAISVNEVQRPCKNFKDANGVKHIHCNQTNYAAAMTNYDAETQYKMVAHEYFAVAGFEPNTYEVSDYPISSQISAQLKNTLVKKWAVKSTHNCTYIFEGNLNSHNEAIAEKMLREKGYVPAFDKSEASYIISIECDLYQDGLGVELIMKDAVTGRQIGNNVQTDGRLFKPLISVGNPKRPLIRRAINQVPVCESK